VRHSNVSHLLFIAHFFSSNTHLSEDSSSYCFAKLCLWYQIRYQYGLNNTHKINCFRIHSGRVKMIDIRNALVILYIFIGYGCSITLLRGGSHFSDILPGIALLYHTLTWSAYMHHELCHNSVFSSQVFNTWCGRIIDWLNGSCFWSFEELRKQHINHHVYKVDYDFSSAVLAWLESKPLCKYSLLVCEYFYFPLHAYIFEWRAILSPWWKNERRFARRRTLVVFIVRLLYFAFMYSVGGLSILLYYLIAYSMAIQTIRFTDSFSHSYDVVPVGTKGKPLTKLYDIMNTFSVVWETDENMSIVCRLFAHLTHIVFFLNFNFHTHHHYATQKKWYELSRPFYLGHHQLTPTENKDVKQHLIDPVEEEYIMNHQPTGEKLPTSADLHHPLNRFTSEHYTIPLAVALRVFHTHRVNRIFKKSSLPVFDPITEQVSLENCYGVTDAPILVLEV
jgi:fatty acid desaturase